MVQVPVGLEDLHLLPLEEPDPESDGTSDAVGVPEEGSSMLSSDAVAFTNSVRHTCPQVESRTMDPTIRARIIGICNRTSSTHNVQGSVKHFL